MMKDINYYKNALSFITSSYNSLSEDIWSDNMLILFKDLIANYKIEHLIDVSHFITLSAKDKFGFTILLIRAIENDSSQLPKWEDELTQDLNLVRKAIFMRKRIHLSN